MASVAGKIENATIVALCEAQFRLDCGPMGIQCLHAGAAIAHDIAAVLTVGDGAAVVHRPAQARRAQDEFVMLVVGIQAGRVEVRKFC